MLIDTCIWSLALRRKTPRDKIVTAKLTSVINRGDVQIIGPIRQELLSGYSDSEQLLKLKTQLEYFPDEAIERDDYITAAEFSNRCRAKGIQGSHTDFLICAVAARLKVEIFTTDKDFGRYERGLPISLYKSSHAKCWAG